MHRFLSLLIVFLAFTTTPLRAQEKGWEMFDSPKPAHSPGKSEAQVIYENLLGLIDAWNSHDVDRYLGFFWKSEALLVIDDTTQLDGWQKLHDFLIKNFPDPALMGLAKSDRIRIRLLTPSLASCLMWLEFTFQGSKKVAQIGTILVQKSEEGWKIICSQTCSAELP